MYSYKDRLVSNQAEAYQLLKDQLVEAGVPYFVLDDKRDFASVAAGPHAIIPSVAGQKEKPILNFAVLHANNAICPVVDFFIGETIQGKGVAGASVKAMLGIAKELSANFLLPSNIVKDGSSFWSYYGAVPVDEPVALAGEIKAVRDLLEEKDQTIVDPISSIAEHNPFLAWRLLSQADDLSENGKKIRQEVFSKICDGQNMLFILAEPTTKAVLQKRLGILPDFEPFDHMDECHPSVEALSRQEASLPAKEASVVLPPMYVC